MQESIDYIVTAKDQASQVFQSIQRNFGGLNKAMREVDAQSPQSNAQSFFSQSTMALMSGTGNMIKGLGDKMAGLTQQIRSSRGDTEAARNGLASMGMGTEALDLMEAKAAEVGMKYGIMTSKIMDANYALKGGMSYLNDEALTGLTELAASVTAATKSTSNTISNMFANAANTVGSEFQNNSEAMKNFLHEFAYGAAAVVNIGKAEGDQVASYTKVVGSGLKNIGLTMAEQFAVMTTAITTQGSGERAATVMTSGIAKGWFKFKKNLEGEGIDTSNFLGTFEQLKERVSKMGNEEKETYLGKIFGNAKSGKMDAYVKKSVNMLLDNAKLTRDAYNGVNTAMEEGRAAAISGTLSVEDSLGKMASAFQSGPQYMMEQMKVRQQNLMEQTAKLIKNTASPFMSLKSSILGVAETLVNTQPQLVGTFLGMSESIGSAVSAFGGFMSQIGNIGRGIESLKLFQKTMDSMGLLNIFKKKAQPVLGPSLNMMKPPKFKQAWFATIKNYVKNYTQAGLKTAINTVKLPALKIKAIIDKKVAGTQFGQITSGIGQKLGGMNWGKIGSGALKIGGGILGAAALALPFAMKDPKMKKDIEGIMKTTMDAIKPVLKSLMPVFRDIITAIKPLIPIILKALMPIFPPLVNIIGKLAKSLVPIIPPLIKIVSKVFAVLIPIIERLLPPFMMLVELFINMASIIVDLLAPVIEWIGNAFAGLVNAIVGMIPDWMLSNEMENSKYASKISAGEGTQEDLKRIVINKLIDEQGMTGLNMENFDSQLAGMSSEGQARVKQMMMTDLSSLKGKSSDEISQMVSQGIKTQTDAYGNSSMTKEQKDSINKAYGQTESVSLLQRISGLEKDTGMNFIKNGQIDREKLESYAMSNQSTKQGAVAAQLAQATQNITIPKVEINVNNPNLTAEELASAVQSGVSNSMKQHEIQSGKAAKNNVQRQNG